MTGSGAPRPAVGLVWVEPVGSEVAALETMAFDSVWAGGHIASPSGVAEAMVQLAQLGAMTERLTIGTSILLLPLYPPAIVAKQVADVDRATGGRVVLGVGVGGEHPAEFAACGIPPAERGSRTDEAIPLLRRLWSAEPVTHHGRHHTFSGVRVHPAPAQGDRVPVVVAGRGPAGMRRAARLGDGWMPQMYSPRRYAESVGQITGLAAAEGRTLERFGWFVFLFVNVRPDGRAARAELAEALAGGGFARPPEVLARTTVAGTPAEVTAQLQAYVDAGVDHLVLAPTPRGERARIARTLGDEVLPGLRRGHRPG